jgi:RimJ/RimL family protein N-acetyltransferase
MNVSLRPLEDRDLDTIYQQVTDPESVRMAAFTAEDQTVRRAFLNRMSRLRADTSVSYRVIDVDGAIAGTIAFFRIDNQPEVTYWVDRTQWGKGIASAALQILLAETAVRPSGLGQRRFASSTGESWVPTRWRQPRLRTRSR